MRKPGRHHEAERDDVHPVRDADDPVVARLMRATLAGRSALRTPGAAATAGAAASSVVRAA